MKVYYTYQDLPYYGKTVFLAGPTPRSKDVKSWRPEALEFLNANGYKGNVLVPENPLGVDYFNAEEQYEWEKSAMNIADDIVFWIPRNMETMPGLTTNIEFGYWLAKNPSKIILGYPLDAENMKYIHYHCRQNDIPVFKDLRELLWYIIL